MYSLLTGISFQSETFGNNYFVPFQQFGEAVKKDTFLEPPVHVGRSISIYTLNDHTAPLSIQYRLTSDAYTQPLALLF